MHHLTAAWDRLTAEDYVSVAEQAMQRAGLVGRRIEMPVGHVDDPAYKAAIAPLNDFVREVTGNQSMRVYYSSYTLMAEGNPIAVTDGLNYIVVRQQTDDLTILHECAHVILRSTENRGGHDRRFAEVARDLYARYISQRAADVFWRNVEWAWK